MSAEDVKNYFWDFNTVEATMLACAIYVTLSGIMFESGQLDKEGNQWQKEFTPVKILQRTFLDWTPCFSQPCPGFSFPRIAFALP